MTTKNLLIFNGLTCLLFGLPLFLLPDTMLGQYMVAGDSLTTIGRIAAKAYGGMLISFGLVLWLARNIENHSTVRNVLLWGILVGNLIALYIWLSAVLTGQLNNLIWVSIIIILITALWAAYLLFVRRGTSAI